VTEVQLVFDLDAPTVAKPVLSRHIPPGAARLLKALVADGLNLDALEAAAALVVALDAEPAGAVVA
jgi:hypothetical protein